MRRKISKEASEARRAAEREKDTIYYLEFIPRDGQPARPVDNWRIELPFNPEGHPKLIDDAIRAFESNHKIESWEELAVRHKVNPVYYP